MAGFSRMILGVRCIGELCLRWVNTETNEFETGDAVLLDGLPASVVVVPNQIHGSFASSIARYAVVESEEAVLQRSTGSEADALDRILREFPQPGSPWALEMRTGTVVSINVRKRTVDVKHSESGETETIPFEPEGE